MHALCRSSGTPEISKKHIEPGIGYWGVTHLSRSRGRRHPELRDRILECHTSKRSRGCWSIEPMGRDISVSHI